MRFPTQKDLTANDTDIAAQVRAAAAVNDALESFNATCQKLRTTEK